jgi:ceramide glucosyltransferase
VAVVIATICIALSACGCLCILLEVAAVRRFAAAQRPDLRSPVGVTLLKPLHGDEPGLLDNLRSFLHQDYPAAVHVVFGVADASDAAVPAVRTLQDEFPSASIILAVTGRSADGNAKIANLVGMSAAADGAVLILSDSDIRVRPDYIARTVASLEQPGVGLVTCLYRGDPSGGLWSVLSAMAIDYHFFPSVLLGVSLGRARPCMGATMAFTRQTLDEIGGFAAFAPFLADDHAIGEAVRRLGKRVVVAAHAVSHRCTESSARELLQHELRWARTIRSIDSGGFAGLLITYPISLALLACALSEFDVWSVGALVAALACGLLLQWQVNRALWPGTSARIQRWVLMPLRDVLSMAVFLCSFFAKAVVWRGRRFRIDADGKMAEMRGGS